MRSGGNRRGALDQRRGKTARFASTVALGLALALGCSGGPESDPGAPVADAGVTASNLEARVARARGIAVRQQTDAPAYAVRLPRTEPGGGNRPATSALFEAASPSGRLRTLFDRDGVRVRTRGGEASARHVSLRLAAIGYEGALEQVAPPAEPTATGNRVEYEHVSPAHPHLLEWYANGPLGLEQGFTIERAPSERPQAGSPLVLEVAFEGVKEATLDEGEARIELAPENGGAALQYGDLLVTDARGERVEATLALEGDRIAIRIDDSGAQYPLTVDPLVVGVETMLWACEDIFCAVSLGTSVDVSGDTIVVGAPGTDVKYNYSQWHYAAGAAWVFVRSGSSWYLSQTLAASDAATGSGFGGDVAIDGDKMVVGALGANAAYVFTRSGGSWTQRAKLPNPNPGVSTFFGRSVDVSGDHLVVGSDAVYSDKYVGGGAYVYVDAASDGNFAFQQALIWAESGGVGSDVAIEGDRVVTTGGGGFYGAYTHSVVFAHAGGSWGFEADLTPNYPGNDNTSVAISGDTVVVGLAQYGHQARVFRRSGTWAFEQTLTPSVGAPGDYFGASVAIDGDTVMVGALGADDLGTNSGKAYLFQRTGTTWSELDTLFGSNTTQGDVFGKSVAVGGQTMVVGAPGADDPYGAAYVFHLGEPDGTPCAADALCASQRCRDGVCCNSHCGGGNPADCQSCAVVPGTCTVLDPSTVCRPSGAVCDVEEHCDGAGTACPANVFASTSTLCRPGTCTAGLAILPEYCAAGGTCPPQTQIDCAPEPCNALGTACGNSCGSDVECPTDYYCGPTSVCEPAENDGTDCNRTRMCASGFCTDGKCCNDACGNSDPTDCQACNVTAGTCTPLATDVVCRAANGECDVEEKCDGTIACPMDDKAPSSTACTADTNPCTLDECDGSSKLCQHPAGNGGAECRAKIGVCDVAESCTGASTVCPQDGVESNTVVCRAKTAGVNCDAEELCDGLNKTCAADGVLGAGTQCRAKSGICDLADVCDGASAACPDGFEGAGFSCRGSAGPCDPEDFCTGIAPTCPINVFSDGTTECRPTAGPCDTAEVCSGAEAACPVDLFASGNVCNPSTDECDPAETCQGNSKDCPPDALDPDGSGCSSDGNVCTQDFCLGGICHEPVDASSAVQCRAPSCSSDVQTLQEFCDGTATCPPIQTINCAGACSGAACQGGCTDDGPPCSANQFCQNGVCVGDLTQGQVCTRDAECPNDRCVDGFCCNADCTGVCESCDATPGTCLPLGSITICRAATAGGCDAAETCDGVTGACPADGKLPQGALCTDDGNPCTVDECDGSGNACTHPVGNPGVECRPVGPSNPCDVAETCTGASATCPADAVAPPTTVCRSPSGPCDVAESCDGSAKTCPGDAVASPAVSCRAATEPCDVEEKCDGSAKACPIDAYQPAAFVCRPSAGVCDLVEACTGTSPTCPPNGFLVGTVCNPSRGECDPAETCPGSVATCPGDTILPDNTPCTVDGNVCTFDLCKNGLCSTPVPASSAVECAASTCTAGVQMLPAVCNGSSVCPAQQPLNCPTGVCSGSACQGACTNDGPPCNVDQYCLNSACVADLSVGQACQRDAQCLSGFCADGVCCDSACGGSSSGDCLACNAPGSVGTCGPAPSGDGCRPVSAGDLCDVPETCNGISTTCPPDAVAPPTTVCRSTSGPCDIAESCDGATKTCPSDAVASLAVVCRAATEPCDVEEKCDGSSKPCPVDAFQPALFVCRPSAGVCDVVEACSGTSPSCPPNGFLAGTVCNPSLGECDPAETCTGSVASCPGDTTLPDNTPCTADANVCTFDLCKNGLCNTPVPAASAVECALSTCAAGVQMLSAVCDGSSVCPAQQSLNCPTGVCSGNACQGGCTNDGPPCSVDQHCLNGTCVADLSVGQTCQRDAQCLSGFCADGVCCDSACGGSSPGDCLACDAPGAVGACGPAPSGDECRPVSAGDPCDVPETCNGIGTTCPQDAVAPPTTVCRSASGPCDVAESCDGSAKTCPGDGVASPAVTCRAATDPCDVEEKCDGSSKPCPADAFAPALFVCRPSAGVCDGVEACSGTSPTCPPNGFLVGTVCNPSRGECDPAETCAGSSATCPGDTVQADNTPCAADANVCTFDVCKNGLCNTPVPASSAVECAPSTCTASIQMLSAACDGSSVCPPQQPLTCPTGVCNGNACQGGCSNDGPPCSVDQHCLNGACVADLSVGQTCQRDAQCLSGFCADGVCCNSACGGSSSVDCLACNAPGSVGTCGAAPSGSECRPAVGICDTAELCDGSSTACPSEAFAPATTTCRPAAGNCDAAEFCTGASAACPGDLFTQSGVECRPSAGPCDVADSCTGASVDCPADAVRSPSTECRATSGPCDVPESCDGASTSCPANGFAGNTVVCRVSSDVCDPPETCSGTLATCPSDLLMPDDSPCTVDSNPCTLDVCRAGTCNQPVPSGQVICRPASCESVASVWTKEATCDGAGACPALETEFCGAEGCNAAQTACTNRCGTHADCPANTWCNAGQCEPDFAASAPCTNFEQCLTGNCVDGVCCDTACSNGVADDCEACSMAAGAQADGTCGPVTDEQPCLGDGNDCTFDVCKGGVCNTNRPPDQVQCRVPSCASDVATAEAFCEDGVCPSPATSTCDATCNPTSTACVDACGSSQDCPAGEYCETSVCVPLEGAGQPCGRNEQCSTGFCVDERCCDRACGGTDTGDCQACSVDRGAEVNGQCGPVTTGACAPVDAGTAGSGGGATAGDGSVGSAGSAGSAGADGGTAFTQPQSSDAGGCGCRTPRGDRAQQRTRLGALALVAAAWLARRRRSSSARPC